MKVFSSFLVLILLIFNSSCSIDAGKSLNGGASLSTWELIEVNISPGGESEFRAIESDETLEFLTGNRIRKNSSWCNDRDVFVVEYNNDNRITRMCNENEMGTSFQYEGEFLIFYGFGCIETCGKKYRKIK